MFQSAAKAICHVKVRGRRFRSKNNFMNSAYWAGSTRCDKTLWQGWEMVRFDLTVFRTVSESLGGSLLPLLFFSAYESSPFHLSFFYLSSKPLLFSIFVRQYGSALSTLRVTKCPKRWLPLFIVWVISLSTVFSNKKTWNDADRRGRGFNTRHDKSRKWFRYLPSESSGIDPNLTVV